ncbi:putative MIND kinetochore complex component Nnf1 [Cladophialophora carrionii]|uniref:Putative MIND kinetochore complex component Nnf1 n=1 Tax=Cladophialophora carrionii TaxID=86049 RepID=A0A1C1CLG2_9EURO|nr:putative MIND kinetochore complex component Nnf1 [Cladophialophora carrionii]
MNGRTSASPSPPPQTPVASAPGPRATALQKVFAGALSASIKANSYANFSSCFPTPAKYCPNALEGVWAQLNTRLEQECMRDFEQILEDRQVVEGLNQWDIMIEEARKRKDRAVEGEMPERPLHTLSAEELYAAHLTPYLQRATDELNTRIQKSQQENTVILGKINEQRAEIEQLLNGLQHVVKDIEGSVDAMRSNQQTSFDELRSDAWQMEQEVAGTR